MDDYKTFAVNLAYEAGKIIKDDFLKGVVTRWKEDSTPITETDTRINRLVINAISEKYPEHSLIGEEQSNLKTSDYVWVCDPIDGTTPFTHGIPLSVFTLALTFKGESILGVIYDPYMDRLAVGEKGKGAFLNGNRISVSKVSEIKNTVIDVETWGTSLYELSDVYKELNRLGCSPTTLRSSVYVGMLIAKGDITAIIFGGKTPWDAAAVKVIVEEAGGKMTDLSGQDQNYNQDISGYIASNGIVHNQLVELVKPLSKVNPV